MDKRRESVGRRCEPLSGVVRHGRYGRSENEGTNGDEDGDDEMLLVRYRTRFFRIPMSVL